MKIPLNTALLAQNNGDRGAFPGSTVWQERQKQTKALIT